MSGEKRLREKRFRRVVIKGKKVRGDDPVNTSSLHGSEVTSQVPEGVMAIEVPQNEEISGGKKSVMPFVEEEQIGGPYT